MYLILKGNAGDWIERSAETMLRIADTLKISVSSKFNDVELLMNPGGSVVQLVTSYKRELDSDNKTKFAAG